LISDQWNILSGKLREIIVAPTNRQEKLEQYQQALGLFLERMEEDRNILAVVQNGSLSKETVWRREGIYLWVIERDGVTKRFLYDGEDERIFRTLTEHDVNLHLELIPRSRFKRMVEGNSRTSFTHNFFAVRTLVYCDDPSLDSWFQQANNWGTKDQERELLVVMTWVIWTHRHALRLLEDQHDLELARQEILCAAHALAAQHVILGGEIYEQEAIYKAVDEYPELFQVVYLDVLSKRKSKKVVRTALDTISEYLEAHAESFLNPLLSYLRKEKRMVSLSELSNHFAHTQLYPWHLESACEWLVKRGRLEKWSSPLTLTKQSRVEVEEPAYMLED